jgi:hypothetical protein
MCQARRYTATDHSMIKVHLYNVKLVNINELTSMPWKFTDEPLNKLVVICHFKLMKRKQRASLRLITDFKRDD